MEYRKERGERESRWREQSTYTPIYEDEGVRLDWEFRKEREAREAREEREERVGREL